MYIYDLRNIFAVFEKFGSYICNIAFYFFKAEHWVLFSKKSGWASARSASKLLPDDCVEAQGADDDADAGDDDADDLPRVVDLRETVKELFTRSSKIWSDDTKSI
jgi:hypothetical protein